VDSISQYRKKDIFEDLITAVENISNNVAMKNEVAFSDPDVPSLLNTRKIIICFTRARRQLADTLGRIGKAG